MCVCRACDRVFYDAKTSIFGFEHAGECQSHNMPNGTYSHTIYHPLSYSQSNNSSRRWRCCWCCSLLLLLLFISHLDHHPIYTKFCVQLCQYIGSYIHMYDVMCTIHCESISVLTLKSKTVFFSVSLIHSSWAMLDNISISDGIKGIGGRSTIKEIATRTHKSYTG